MKLEKNDAWAVANEEIKTLQEIIQDANAKLQNQENELKREQNRGNELEQKIYEAQIKARSKLFLDRSYFYKGREFLWGAVYNFIVVCNF